MHLSTPAQMSGQPAHIGGIGRDVTELSSLRRTAEILSETGRHSEDDEAPLTASPAMREVLRAAEIVAQQDFGFLLAIQMDT